MYQTRYQIYMSRTGLANLSCLHPTQELPTLFNTTELVVQKNVSFVVDIVRSTQPSRLCGGSMSVTGLVDRKWLEV